MGSNARQGEEMTREEITIKITSISTVDKSHLDKPYLQDFIQAQNEGQQSLELTRFYSPGEVQLKVGNYYKGYVEAPKKQGNRAKFTLISPVTEFNGVETPFDDEPKSQTPDERQLLIVIQTAMKATAHYYQPKCEKIPFLEIMDEVPDVVKKIFDIANKLKAEGV